MPVRLLISCGLLAIACPVSAQVYDGYGHGTSSYGYAVPVPHHNNYGPLYGHHGRAIHSHGHEYRVPNSFHGHAPIHHGYGYTDFIQQRPMVSSYGYSEYGNRYGVPICDAQAHCDQDQGGGLGCHGPGGCSGRDFAGQFGRPGDTYQHDLGDSHAGHSHDHGHAHGNPSPLPYPGDSRGLRDVPGRDQVSPRLQTPSPSDRQPLTPPSLPPFSQSQRSETPLGDAPPPPTVPMTSPRGLRSAESNLLNI